MPVWKGNNCSMNQMYPFSLGWISTVIELTLKMSGLKADSIWTSNMVNIDIVWEVFHLQMLNQYYHNNSSETFNILMSRMSCNLSIKPTSILNTSWNMYEYVQRDFWNWNSSFHIFIFCENIIRRLVWVLKLYIGFILTKRRYDIT